MAQRLPFISSYSLLLVLLFGVKSLFLGVEDLNFPVADSCAAYGLLNGVIDLMSFYLRVAIGAGLMLFNGFFLTRIILKYFNILKNVYTPAVIYIAFSASLFSFDQSIVPQLELFLLLYFIDLQLMVMRDKDGGKVFKGAIFFGCCAILNPLMWIFSIMLISTLLYAHILNLRNFFGIVVGSILPLFFCEIWVWLKGGFFGSMTLSLIQPFKEGLFNGQFIFEESIFSYYILICFLSLEVLVAIILYFAKLKSYERVGYYYAIFVWIVIILVLAFMPLYSYRGSLLLLLIPSVTVMVTILIFQLRSQFWRVIFILLNTIFPLIYNLF